jgi:hypothetical protein
MVDAPLKGQLWLLSVMRGGLVSNPDTALKLAEILMAEIQGPDITEGQRPFVVSDGNDRWIVEGKVANPAEAWRGAPRIEIGKQDARVLDVRLPVLRFIAPDLGDAPVE